jgi:hypothetical protein
MQKLIITLVFLLLVHIFPQSVSPHFSELKGFEDQQGNTHLFYRIYTLTNDSVYFWSNTTNNIYHYDLHSLEDSLFLESYSRLDTVYYITEDYIVNDLTFWQNNPLYFIFGGATEVTILSEETFIQRFDSENTYHKGGMVYVIQISSQNDSLLYAGVSVWDMSSHVGTIRSTNGGWNWSPLPDWYQLVSLDPLNDQTLFSSNASTNHLYKSTDGGNNYYVIDSTFTFAEQQYCYDPSVNYIYRIARNVFTNDYYLKVTSNSGEPLSWVVKYTSPDKLYISNNKSVTGEIYLAVGNSIYNSSDYGDDFNFYKDLEDDIVGIYRKPNSSILYAATTFRIYEFDINDDSLRIIKSITPVSENYNWFPLRIGNCWVYGVYTSGSGGTEYLGDETKSLIDTVTLSNGQKYFLYKQIFINGDADTTYIRLDSLSGILYAYSFETQSDLLYDNLSAEAGDTVCYEFNPAFNCQYVQMERNFPEFGLNTLKKDYYPQAPGWYFGHSLVKGLGLYEVFNGDLTTFRSTLKGCVIDGVVFGDTLTVPVDDDNPTQPSEFSLSQNYPNPFNPSTKIRFTISPARTKLYAGGDLRFTILKVYDVLGREVATLVNEEKPAGEYEVDFYGKNLSSGIYFYQIEAGSFIETKKMNLLK